MTDTTNGTVFGGLSTLAGSGTDAVGGALGSVVDTATAPARAGASFFEGIMLKIAVIVAVTVGFVVVMS